MSRAVIGRWGKNLAVRFPSDIVEAVGLDEGQRVEITSRKGELVIRKMPPALTAESLFRGKSAEAWRALYSDAYDWGEDRGRERVEE